MFAYFPPYTYWIYAENYVRIYRSRGVITYFFLQYLVLVRASERYNRNKDVLKYSIQISVMLLFYIKMDHS